MATAKGNTSFTITLPNEIIAELMLLKVGKHYGTDRATIARSLILDMLKTSDVREQIREARAKAAGQSS